MIKQNKFLSLKDYEFSLEVDAKSRSEAFQNYINQLRIAQSRNVLNVIFFRNLF